MNRSLVTQADVDRLLAYLPKFRNPKGAFRTPSTSWQPAYTDDVWEFFSMLEASPLMDMNYSPERECDHIESPEYIEQANIDELRALLTYICRGERFCDGYWLSVLRDGSLVAVLDRLAQHRDSLPR